MNARASIVKDESRLLENPRAPLVDEGEGVGEGVDVDVDVDVDEVDDKERTVVILDELDELEEEEEEEDDDD